MLEFCPFSYDEVSCLFCWVEPIMVLSKNHWRRERIQAKEAQECHWLDFSQLLLRNPVLLSSTPPLVTRFSHWLCSDYVLFALLSWTYIAFQAKNHWSGERIQAKEAQECHWLDFSQLLLRNPVLLEVSQRNSAKEKKPRLTINCWGESLCSLVNPLVDSHPPIHSDMVKTPVNKCRFSPLTSE